MQRPHGGKDPEGLQVEGLAAPLGDAVVVDGGVRQRPIPLEETLPGVESIAGEAAAELGVTGVVVEVGIAATDGAPVEEALIQGGALGEHPVQRERLARPSPEAPGDTIGQPVRVAGPAAAPGVFRHLALEIPRRDRADVRVQEVVVGDPEGGEEGQLADQDSVLEAAGGRGGAGGNVELERAAHTLLDVHGRDREIGLVVGVAPCPILAHDDPTRQVARLDTAVHFGAGRVQDIELAGRLIEGRAEHLVAASADDQERVASQVGIDGHNVVAERLIETWGRGSSLHSDLLVQVDVFGLHLSQGIGVHGIDERLDVAIKALQRLRLGADIGQIQTLAANQRRQQLVREDPLGVLRDRVIGRCRVRIRTVDRRGPVSGVRGDGHPHHHEVEIRAEAAPVGGEAGMRERGQGDFGDRRVARGHPQDVDDPCFPRSRASPPKGSFANWEARSAKSWVTKTLSSERLPPVSVIARAVGLPPTCTEPWKRGVSGLSLGMPRMEMVPSVWFAT